MSVTVSVDTTSDASFARLFQLTVLCHPGNCRLPFENRLGAALAGRLGADKPVMSGRKL
jgi:hypothetical protein